MTSERERMSGAPGVPAEDAAPGGTPAAVDRVLRLAAGLLEVPIALVCLATATRQRAGARLGIAAGELPRLMALAARVQAEHAAADAVHLPAEPGAAIGFFVATPLVTSEGRRLGLLCVADRAARAAPSAERTADLTRLAGLAADLLAARGAARTLRAQLAQRGRAERRLRLVEELTGTVLDAGDLKGAVSACLEGIARHIAADTALAFGAAPGAERCELWASHRARPADRDGLTERIRGLAVGADNSLSGETVAAQRVTAVADLGVIDAARYPLVETARRQGFRSFIGVPFENGGGRFGLVFLFRRRLHDIDELAAMTAGLAARLGRILARKQAAEARHQAMTLEAVSRLAGGVAHDFNNLLTIISGNLELAERRLAGDPAMARLVGAATRAAARAERLTHQLIAFARRQPLKPQPVDCNRLIGEMEEMIRRILGDRITVECQLAADLWPALSDPDQLATALVNLFINARDAMPEGGRLAIATANIAFVAGGPGGPAPGAYAELSIGDSGRGMNPEVLAHIFEPFFTSKPAGAEPGLGLSRVYGFARQSSGHLAIESEPGRGTRVRLYLPRYSGVGQQAGTEEVDGAADGAAGNGAAGNGAAADEAALAPGAQRRQGRQTVLVVEDDQGVREFAAAVLREHGYHVLEAASGESALDLLARARSVDLLFTDVVMPGPLHGLALAQTAVARRPDLKVVFTSAYASRLGTREWPVQKHDFLRKPYRPVELAQRVRAALDQPCRGAGRRRAVPRSVT